MFTLSRFIKYFFALFILGISSVTTHVNAANLAIDHTNNLAFSAVAGGVIILDFNDPENISLASDTIQTAGVVKGLFYVEETQLLYIAAEDGDLQIWDIQNPAAPIQLSVTPLFYFDHETPAIAVAVVGSIAHVSTDWGYLHYVDVSNPDSPKDLGFNASGGNPSREVELANDGRLYLAAPDTVQFNLNADDSVISATSNIYATSFQVFADHNNVYASHNRSLQIMNANESGLPFINTYSVGGPINDIYADGTHVFIASSSDGLRILDISNLPDITEISIEDSDYALDVRVKDRYAYVRGSLSFRVVDIIDPNNPKVISTFDINSSDVSNIAPVANAGPSRSVVSKSQVTLNGGGYDVDGSIEGYS